LSHIDVTIRMRSKHLVRLENVSPLFSLSCRWGHS